MRLLILGGTWFLGRTLAEQAIARSWHVTTFNRGRSGTPVPGVESVNGDRSSAQDVRALATQGPWDAVVDTSGYDETSTRLAADALAAKVNHYIYISTVNAYRGWPYVPLSDVSPTLTKSPDQTRSPAEAYGAGKAACERAVTDTLGEQQSLILRPGVLLGPYEYVGRLPWLLRRMQRGGSTLAAGGPWQPIQPLDVRDLAAFTLDAISRGLAGAMNVTAPIGHSTYGELLNTCNQVTGDHAELVWVDADWLEQQDVTPWSEIPLWRTTAGAWNVTSERASEAGLQARPLQDTITDTWEWLQREPPMQHPRQDDIGLTTDKEAALLAEWESYANGSDAGGSARGADADE